VPRQPIIRRHQLIEGAVRRSGRFSSIEAWVSVLASFGSRRSKSAQDRIPGMAANADDIGKAEF